DGEQSQGRSWPITAPENAAATVVYDTFRSAAAAPPGTKILYARPLHPPGFVALADQAADHLHPHRHLPGRQALAAVLADAPLRVTGQRRAQLHARHDDLAQQRIGLAADHHRGHFRQLEDGRLHLRRGDLLAADADQL